MSRRWQWLLTALCLSTAAGCASAASQRDQARQAYAQELTAQELYRRGEATATLGDMTRAEQYFVGALKAGGDEKKITQRLLVVCVRDQRYPVALQYAEQYLERHPLDLEIKFAAASIHAALGHNDIAQPMFEEVVRKKPDWAEPHYALATLLRQESSTQQQADLHDLEYLRLEPNGSFAERARDRIRRSTP